MRRDAGEPGEDGGRDGRNGDPAWSMQVEALGGFIRAQRQMARLSLREMSAMTSVSNAYLSQVERGLHLPSLKVLHSIADALQLSTEQLLAHAGWAPADDPAPAPAEAPAGGEAPGTEDVIARDPRLTPDQRAALLSVYRSFVETPPTSA
ncbi:MAG: helix-turn-helix transcriptional regulator [Pseudonocardiales bacterium]|nr:helix-turn-helix transcriptional regulator [Pseudonocardiales bacterium]